MRIMFVCIILLMLFSASKVFAVKENLSPNSSFENGKEMPDAWQIFRRNADNALFEWDKNTSHSGTSSIKISAPGFVWNASWVSEEIIRVDPSRIYTFSAWIKTMNVKGKAVLYLSWLGKDSKYKGGVRSKALVLTNDWTKLSLVNIKVPPGIMGVTLNCSLWESTGTVWFDDLEFYEEEINHVD